MSDEVPVVDHPMAQAVLEATQAERAHRGKAGRMARQMLWDILGIKAPDKPLLYTDKGTGAQMRFHVHARIELVRKGNDDE